MNVRCTTAFALGCSTGGCVTCINTYKYWCHLCIYALMEGTFPAGTNAYCTLPKQKDKFCTLENAPICPPQYILLLLLVNKQFSNYYRVVIMFCTLRWDEASLKIPLKSWGQFWPPHLTDVGLSRDIGYSHKHSFHHLEMFGCLRC